jgi:hypothetical protein
MAQQITPPPLVMVTLETVRGGERQDFIFDQAKRILEHEKNLKISAWRLPDDSPYILKNGDFINRGGLKTDKRAEKFSGHTKGQG